MLKEIQNAVEALKAVPAEFRSLVLAEIGAGGKRRGPKPGFKRVGKKPGPKPGSKRAKPPIEKVEKKGKQAVIADEGDES